jgi:hypothetical protein
MPEEDDEEEEEDDEWEYEPGAAGVTRPPLAAYDP